MMDELEALNSAVDNVRDADRLMADVAEKMDELTAMLTAAGQDVREMHGLILAPHMADLRRRVLCAAASIDRYLKATL